jgi:hypothetical protein
MAGRVVVSTLNNDTGVLATQNGMTGIAKAWVNFTGTTAAINGSFNISSVTRTGTGDYTISFTTNMTNANYAVIGSSSPNSGYGQVTFVATNSLRASGTNTTNTTSSFQISTLNSTSSVAVDTLVVNIAVLSA